MQFCREYLFCNEKYVKIVFDVDFKYNKRLSRICIDLKIKEEEKDKQFAEALESLKDVQGPVMIAMQKTQDIYGYLPLEVQLKIADYFGVPLATVYGIATFYSQFRLEQPGQIKIAVCLGTACYVKGSGNVLDKFARILNVEPGHTTPDGRFTLEATRCIGCCGLAPVLTVNGEVYGKVTEDSVDEILAKYNEA